MNWHALVLKSTQPTYSRRTSMEKTWRAAITRVLKESAGAMHYSDIAEQILTNGYYKSKGATPAATVNSQLASSINSEGAMSPFVRVSPGVFSLKYLPSSKPEDQTAGETEVAQTQGDLESKGKFINSFGMYWQRELVIWKSTPKLYGRAPGGTVSIDFSSQRGIYLLYDRHTPIYVGRSTDQAIGLRLFQHTLGRLAGRWNQFSWFGVLEPTTTGKLVNVQPTYTEAAMVSTLEALLIESLEPPQNRRQGDGFKGCEYVQDIDPQIKKQHLVETMLAIGKKLSEDE